MQTIIDIADHPHNSDPAATLVSGSRERLSIFKVQAGFVPVLDGRTYPHTFATEAAAREAARGLGA